MAHMHENQARPADKVRRYILRGRSLWSLLGFYLLGVVSSVFLILTLFHGLDIAPAIGTFSSDFLAATLSLPHDAVTAWLEAHVDEFQAARGTLYATPLAWVILIAVMLLLFFGHYNRFDKAQGPSLLEIPKAAPVAQAMLNMFGFFRDIRIPESDTGRASLDFMALGRVFYAPRGQVSRILKGKKSDALQERLSFFMAHEYAHVVTKDNWANSAFLILVSAYVLFFVLFATPVLLFIAMVAATSPFTMSIFPLLGGLFYILLIFGILGCFWGMLVSHLKAREFFADAVGYHLYPDQLPYGSPDGLLRPNRLSALSPNITRYERELHRQGVSLHARNMLVFFWGFFLAVRSLYLLFAPPHLSFYILIFDGVMLASFICLYASLPKRAKKPHKWPRLPWLVTFLGVTASTFTFPSVLGIIAMKSRSLVPEAFGQLVNLPASLLFFYFLFALLVLALRSLFSRRALPDRQPSKLLKQMALRSVMMPGMLFDGFLLVMTISYLFSLLYGLTIEQVAQQQWPVIFILVGIACLLIVQIYGQYRGLFSQFDWQNAALSVVASIHFALFAILLAGFVQSIQAPTQFDPDFWRYTDFSLERFFSTQPLSLTLSIGVLSAIFYLVLRMGAFWARDQLTKIDMTSGRHYINEHQ